MLAPRRTEGCPSRIRLDVLAKTKVPVETPVIRRTDADPAVDESAAPQ